MTAAPVPRAEGSPAAADQAATPATTQGMTSTEVTVGVLGAGNVGAALIELIDAHGDDIETRTGLRLRVVRVAVRSMSRSAAWRWTRRSSPPMPPRLWPTRRSTWWSS
nr:hypothetical protein [Candidatus Microthrix sp.]